MIIAREESKSCNVPDVLEMINRLLKLAPVSPVEVNLVTGEGAAMITRAALDEETLTDGSKVYNIELM